MLSKFSRFLTIATLTTLTCIITHPSEAKPVQDNSSKVDIVEVSSPLSVNELVNQAFSENSGTFYEQATIDGALNTILGWRTFPEGSYPENNVARDGLLLSTIMSDYFKQLQKEDPIFRTKDLNNPFDSSLNEDPSNYLR
jgi:hypothetical protein